MEVQVKNLFAMAVDNDFEKKKIIEIIMISDWQPIW